MKDQMNAVKNISNSTRYMIMLMSGINDVKKESTKMVMGMLLIVKERRQLNDRNI